MNTSKFVSANPLCVLNFPEDSGWTWSNSTGFGHSCSHTIQYWIHKNDPLAIIGFINTGSTKMTPSPSLGLSILDPQKWPVRHHWVYQYWIHKKWPVRHHWVYKYWIHKKWPVRRRGLSILDPQKWPNRNHWHTWPRSSSKLAARKWTHRNWFFYNCCVSWLLFLEDCG